MSPRSDLRRSSFLNRAAHRSFARAGVPALLTLLALGLSGCNWNSLPTFGQPRGADIQGNDISKLYSAMFIAGLIVAGLVWGLIFFSVVRYRRRRNEEGLPPRQVQNNYPLEITYTIIPILMVFAIFAFTVITENEVDNVAPKPAAVVDVTGYQWGWIFDYQHSNGVRLQTAEHQALKVLPQSYTSPIYPPLVLPENETTRIVLKSNDVIHEFFVSAFNFGRFAQPGITNVFDFTPTKLGVYPAQCVEYCGLYHSEMLFSVKVVTPSQYRAWLKQQESRVNIPANLAAASR
ncbi:MAG: cytochrome c oxidase subunit II [Acidimicrobiales bacterium]